MKPGGTAAQNKSDYPRVFCSSTLTASFCLSWNNFSALHPEALTLWIFFLFFSGNLCPKSIFAPLCTCHMRRPASLPALHLPLLPENGGNVAPWIRLHGEGTHTSIPDLKLSISLSRLERRHSDTQPRTARSCTINSNMSDDCSTRLKLVSKT